MNVNLSNPFEIIIVLTFLSVVPFAAVMVTSFTKIIVVLGLLRNALGLQTTPPNLILNGLALVVSIYVMFPVIGDTWKKASQTSFANITMESLPSQMEELSAPIRKFLLQNSSPKSQEFFVESARKLWPPDYASGAKREHILILIPSFIVSEISAAFQIGFVIYLPFVIIDLVVSNILMALGIIMIAPTIISLPFKLLLFCLIDGWMRLIQGLLVTYHF